MLSASENDLQIAASRLRDEGLLVAFPTETVYGLGANALNDQAARRIFEVKGRPPTDPLICHVASLDKARALWKENEEVVNLGLFLGNAFWPGPITFVAEASSAVPPCVTGGSGFVGVRIPDHPIALAFLEECGVPVAAPSANTFGHVSPTTAMHVMKDLASRDSTLRVIDGGSASIGIESTVAKLHPDARTVEILRRGKVTVSQIEACLNSSKYAGSVFVTVRDTRSKFSAAQEDRPMDGPGQLLTHYSPTIPSFLVTPASVPFAGINTVPTVVSVSISPIPSPREGDPVVVALSNAVVLDFNGVLRNVLKGVLAYRSLSDCGSVDEACHEVFDALRWVESVEGAQVALFPLLSEWECLLSTISPNDRELLAAVEDRLFRAASGQVARLNL